MNSNLSLIFLSKLREQSNRILHLLPLVPEDKLKWHPPQLESEKVMTIEILIGHLLDSFAGFCAALYAAKKDDLAHFLELRELRVNHPCSIEEAHKRIDRYMSHIEEGLLLITDEDLAEPIVTVFVPQGEPLMTLLLGNLEHIINHKYQLFFYLKLLGLPVNSRNLYVYRGL
jgi:hypothetical protein